MALDRGVDYDTDSPGCVCPDPENYRQVGGPGNWLLPAVIPCLLVWGVQCYMGVGLGEVLRILFFYLSLWGYVVITDQRLRCVLFSLLFPFLYLLLSSGGCSFCMQLTVL